ncbi:MAG: diphosphate--fructose-6-phosphate 1-phosphotransferase [Ruminococcaceae bacterium]|nr:diphosphate--fructose-6-phosphate 1-phosphotransferase [Oscillospiraceae bacterium]
MSILKGAAVVGQSGGPTAAINATLAGVIKGAIENPEAITKLYGMRNGIEGFIGERICDLSEMFTSSYGVADEEKLSLLAATPAAALGSCRKKLPKPEDDKAFFENLISLFKKYDVRYFFYIGGNDSMDTVAKLTAYLKDCDYEMKVMGVPKTIDNDLAGTDHTPGFGSAAKYIAATVSEIIRDCAVYTVPAVTIVEIMGRDAGWLTASAGLPALLGRQAPDYIYLPEVPFSMSAFLDDVREALKKHPNVVIAVSEGVRDENGKYAGESAQSGVTDAFGHKYLSGTGKALEMAVKAEIGCKVRSIELNLPQRCAAHLQSATDIAESRGVGAAAVAAAVAGKTGCMMAMDRCEGEYAVEFNAKEIAGIANAVRSVPREMINEAGNYVTDECLKYIYPLVQGEMTNKYENGLPVHFVI